MFITTLKKISDYVVSLVDKRRFSVPQNKFDLRALFTVSKMYIALVERHAPNKLYLPSRLTFESLYKDFPEKNPLDM